MSENSRLIPEAGRPEDENVGGACSAVILSTDDGPLIPEKGVLRMKMLVMCALE